MFKKGIIVTIVIIVLAALLAGFISQWFIAGQQLQASRDLLKTYQYNEKILAFTKFFVSKVLKAQADVSFEDRLKLENDVRALNDKEILDQWQAFVNSKDEKEAQTQVRNLLDLLISKVVY